MGAQASLTGPGSRRFRCQKEDTQSKSQASYLAVWNDARKGWPLAWPDMAGQVGATSCSRSAQTVQRLQGDCVVVLEVGSSRQDEQDSLGKAVFQNRLRKEAVHACLEALVPVTVRGVGSHGNDGYLLPELTPNDLQQHLHR